MGAVNTTYTFTATDTITSTKMNDIIDQTTFTDDAVFDTTLFVAAGKLKVNAQGITSNELAENAVKTIAIENGAVTQAKASNMLVPAGAVMPFAMNSAPTGWLAANGAEYSKSNSTYLALFTAIGTVYGETDGSGGVGTTHFRVPDLRGYFVRGFGSNSDGTVSSGSFGTKQGANVGSHTHSTTVGFNQSNDNGSGALGGQPYGADQSFSFTSDNGSQTGETRPANIAMLYCIKI